MIREHKAAPLTGPQGYKDYPLISAKQWLPANSPLLPKFVFPSAQQKLRNLCVGEGVHHNNKHLVPQTLRGEHAQQYVSALART